MSELLKQEDLRSETGFDSMESIKKRELNPSDILSDPEKIKKILKIVDTCDESEYHSTIVEFGEQFLPANFDAVLFYLSCESGLIGSAYNYDQGLHGRIIKYLRLQKDDPSSAEEYRVECVKELRHKNKAICEAVEYLRENYDLSKIIENMPRIILEPTTLIQKGLNGKDTSYLGGIIYVKEELDDFNETVKGKIVIDLGAGGFASAGLELSIEAGAIGYIAVEKYNYIGLLDKNIRVISRLMFSEEGQEKVIKPKVHMAPTDILTFLRKMPDQTENVVIVASGIDMYILGTTGDTRKHENENQRKIRENNEDYVEQIQKELTRVLGKGSNFYKYHSDIYHPKSGE